MKNLFFCSIALLICCFTTSCGDSSSSEAAQQDNTSKEPQSLAEKIATEDMSNKTDDALADSACKCFEKFYRFRESVKKEYDGGDKEAYERNNYELKDERILAKNCSRKVVEPLKGNDKRIQAFEDALLKKCPHSTANILILSKIKFKPLEE